MSERMKAWRRWKTRERGISAADAAEIIGCNRNYVTYLAKKGYVKAEKDGGRWFFDPEDVKRFASKPAGTGRPRGSLSANRLEVVSEPWMDESPQPSEKSQT